MRRHGSHFILGGAAARVSDVGVWGESRSSLNQDQKDGGGVRFVFKKWGEKQRRERKLSNFVQKRNKYLLWSSDVSRGVGRTPRGYSNSRAGAALERGQGRSGTWQVGTQRGPVGVTPLLFSRFSCACWPVFIRKAERPKEKSATLFEEPSEEK